ncbi:MAG: hypothetical protein WCE52_18905 [Candidatus Acidiferrum sp.]
MKTHVGTIATMIAAALACAATFLLALFRQYGLVEVAASLGAGLEVFSLSSSIGDYLEDRPEPNRLRIVAALVLAAGVVGYFLLPSACTVVAPNAISQGCVSSRSHLRQMGQVAQSGTHTHRFFESN